MTRAARSCHSTTTRSLGDKNYKEEVSTDGCSNVAQFRVAIKSRLSPILDSYATAQLTLFQPDGVTEIDPETPITDLQEIPWKPMVATVEELRIGSSKKQLSYNKLSVESSLRKFFDVLALKLSSYYKFNWGLGNTNFSPTFGDVVYAYKNQTWKHKYTGISDAERTDESGFTQAATRVPLQSTGLTDLFNAAEWAKLEEWNHETNRRIHSAELPTSNGNRFVVVPHIMYNQETIDFFKTIGVRGNLIVDESMLDVKDGDQLSGSSSSESGSPDKDKKM